MPPSTAPKYSISSELAYELTIQPAAMPMPPIATISFGPFCGPILSTSQPSTGVSQVSSAMKTLKATWMAATDQPCLAAIGCTNSVQPYCRLAIMIMQIMPAMSWVQRSLLKDDDGLTALLAIVRSPWLLLSSSDFFVGRYRSDQ